MKNMPAIGSTRRHLFTVQEEDVAAFNNEVVHQVCSTYALGREMEWAGRLFVLDICEEHEEGVGTMLQINHHKPAFPGDVLLIDAIVTEFQGNELICDIVVCNEHKDVIASGKTGQKILDRKFISELFNTKKNQKIDDTNH